MERGRGGGGEVEGQRFLSECEYFLSRRLWIGNLFKVQFLFKESFEENSHAGYIGSVRTTLT